MTENTKKALKAYGALFTFSSGHPNDLERFYQFVAVAFREGDVNIQFDEFKNEFIKIREEDVNETILIDIFSKYNQAIEVIKVYKNGTLFGN